MRKASRAVVVKDNNLLVMHRNKFGHEYYALVGGGIDLGETPEQALHRELQEESGITVTNPQLAIIEDAGDMYGIQYIYLCDYVSGEPALDSNSIEAKITEGGKNLYKPLWLPIKDLPATNLLPLELKDLLVTCLEKGFPAEPISLTVRP